MKGFPLDGLRRQFSKVFGGGKSTAPKQIISGNPLVVPHQLQSFEKKTQYLLDIIFQKIPKHHWGLINHVMLEEALISFLLRHNHPTPEEISVIITPTKIKIKFFDFLYEFKRIGSTLYEGQFEYIYHLMSKELIQGKKTFENGLTEEGTWEYSSAHTCMLLIKGKVTYPNGCIENGTWGYSPSFQAYVLEKGERRYPDGTLEKGSFRYEPDKKTTLLYQGTITYPSAITQEIQV